MDTGYHADLEDLISASEGWVPLNTADMHIGDQQDNLSRFAPVTHEDERTCSNCHFHDTCWQPRLTIMPANFSFRTDWNETRFQQHIRSVTGQICGHFQHSNREIHARHVQAERRRREEYGEGNEWDTEEN